MVKERTPPRGLLRRAAWLPIPILLTAMAGLWIVNLRVVWPLPTLNWLIHYGSAALGVVFIVIAAGRSFLANGQPSVLMLGCGVLMTEIGAAAMPAGFARTTGTGFAIYNTSVLLSALCHFTGVAITALGTTRLRRSATWLIAAFASATATMGLVIWLALTDRMPIFFIDGVGGTPLRSLVVTAAVALFLLTAGLLWQTNRRTASSFLHWYALGLALAAAGLAGSMAIAVRDSPLQWATRFTQVVGLVYMCVAVLASALESSGKGVALEVLEESWRENEFLASLRRQTPLGWVLRYGLAVGGVAAALWLKLALEAWVGPGLATYITFYPVVMAVALVAGFGPGSVATALTGLAVGYWVLPPVGQFSIASPVDRLGVVIFSGMGLFMSAFAELYRRSRDKAAAYDREAALRESQTRLATFAEATFEGIVESEAGRIVDCNEQFARMFGYTVEELRRMAIADLIAPEDRDRVMANIRQGRESVIEHAACRKDGTRIVIEAHGRPVSPGSARRHSAVRDITERKQADWALQTTLQRFYVVLSSMYSEILLVADDGRVEFANQAFCDGFGLKEAPADLVGLASHDMIGKIKHAYLHPDEAVARIREIVERQQPVKGEELAMHDGRRCLRDYVPLNVGGRSYGRLWLHFDITARTQAEEALRESQERYRSLFNGMTEGFALHEIITDEAGTPVDYRFLDINPAFERLTGLKRVDVLGRRLLEVLPNNDPSWVETYGKVALTGEPTRLENFSTPLNRWYEAFAYQPAPRQFAVIFTDITARKQAEEALRRATERERFLADVVETADVAFGVGAPDGRLLMFNQAFADLTGYSREELDQRQLTWAADLTPPEWREDENARLAEAVRARQPVRYEKEYLRKDGTRVPIELFVQPVFDATGTLLHFRSFLADITERKRAEATLRESQSRLETVFAAIPDVILEYDAGGSPVRANAAALKAAGLTSLSFTRDQAVAKLRFTYLDGSAVRTEDLPTSRASRGEIVAGDLFAIRIADGDERVISTYAAPICHDGTVSGVVALWHDITALKRAEEGLRQERAALEQHVAARTAELSHALQQLSIQSTQLRALASELTLVEQRERLRLAEQIHDGLQQLLVAARFRVTQVGRGEAPAVQHECQEIGQLLDEALADSRSLTAELSPPILRTGGLLAGLQWLARWSQEKYRLKVQVAVPAALLPPLPEDLTVLLFQSVRELLFNAVKYAQAPEATVTVAWDSPGLTLTVADAGTGFDPQGLRGEGGGGGGFGLARIRHRLELLGGCMNIDSKHGGGTRVTLAALVPTADRPATTPAPLPQLIVSPQPAPAPDLGSPQKIRILVVDDHQVVRHALAQLLHAEADLAVVGEAGTGTAALALARQLAPDVVLMDINMPEMNGIEATRAIHVAFPTMRVIGLSMFGREDQQAAMQAAGAVAYVSKSAPAEELLAAIREGHRHMPPPAVV